MRTALKTLSVATAVLCLSAGVASADAKYNLKMTTTTPEGTVTWKMFAEDIENKIAIATNGEMKIKAYGSGALAGLFEGHKAVADGRADLAHQYPAFEINQSPASAFISAIPGGMGSDAKMMWVLAGGGKQLWAGYRNSQGLMGLICGAIGAEIFAHSHKKIQKLADLKGFKYRTAGANTQVMRKLGARPTLVPGPEVFTLLERKGVDGAEYLDPYGNNSLGFAKIAKYIIIPGMHAPSALYELLMKKSMWDKLPKNIQKQMEVVCDSVLINSYAVSLVNNVKAMKEFAASKKNEIVTLDREVQEAIRAGGRAWAAEKIASEAKKGNMWMGKLAESYYAFQDDWKNNSSYQVLDAVSK